MKSTSAPSVVRKYDSVPAPLYESFRQSWTATNCSNSEPGAALTVPSTRGRLAAARLPRYTREIDDSARIAGRELEEAEEVAQSLTGAEEDMNERLS